jgi:hypothetical protein
MSFLSINLKLIDHFDFVINDIDIEAEIQLMQCQNDFKKLESINNIREKLIEEINLMKESCDLRKRSDIVDIFALEIKDLFKEFCFFIENKYLVQYQDYDLGLLVKTNFYISEDQINDLKYLKNNLFLSYLNYKIFLIRKTLLNSNDGIILNQVLYSILQVIDLILLMLKYYF